MKLRKAIALLCAGVMLGGCSDSEIKERSISDIKEEIQSSSFSEYDNLTFDCSLESFDANEVYIITTKSSKSKSCDESSKQELKKYIDLLYGTDVDVNDMEYSFELTDHSSFLFAAQK